MNEHSNFEGLISSSGKGSSGTDNVQAVVMFIKEYYFAHIISAGYHILNSIPVWKTGSSPPSFGLTFVTFHVYCKHIVERQTWAQIPKEDEPAIVILGMTNFRPKPEILSLGFSVNWVVQAIKGVSYGTVCISANSLMKERLLSILARINALTTLLPSFSDMDEGVWTIELIAWSQHKNKQKRVCQWRDAEGEAGIPKYKWEHHEEWTHKHSGTDHAYNGSYNAASKCRLLLGLCVSQLTVFHIASTANYVHIPTKFNRGLLEIKLEGTSSFKSDYEGALGSWMYVFQRLNGSGAMVLTLAAHCLALLLLLLGTPPL